MFAKCSFLSTHFRLNFLVFAVIFTVISLRMSAWNRTWPLFSLITKSAFTEFRFTQGIQGMRKSKLQRIQIHANAQIF